MAVSAQLLILSLGLYFFSLLAVFLLRFALKKYTGKRFAVPYDRLPIAIALVLLAVTAGVYAAGNEKMANDLAIMAYYLLVLGVLLQIVTYIGEQRAERLVKGSRGKDSGSRGKSEDHPAEDE